MQGTRELTLDTIIINDNNVSTEQQQVAMIPNLSLHVFMRCGHIYETWPTQHSINVVETQDMAKSEPIQPTQLP